MIEINLICPNCGCYLFEAEGNGKYLCSECEWIGEKEEMIVTVYDAD